MVIAVMIPAALIRAVGQGACYKNNLQQNQHSYDQTNFFHRVLLLLLEQTRPALALTIACQ
jgi:hypothetical protein